MAETQNGTAAASEEKKPSPLDEIRKQYDEGKIKVEAGPARDKVIREWQAADDEVRKQEKVLEAAKLKLDTHVLTMARTFGGQSIKIKGVIHDFVARGGRVFFRRKSVNDVIEI